MESYRFGSIELRMPERLLYRDGHYVHLGSRALDILVVLVERRPQLVSKSELLDVVWAGRVVEEANVQVQVSSLRKVLGPNIIATIPGRGYRFIAALESDGFDEVGSHASGERDSEPRRATNLPAAVDPLIGRQYELTELVELTLQHRLVAILGPGGIGKTRLAQEVGRRLVDHVPDGVWWVDLAAVDNPSHIVVSVAKAVHVQIGGDVSDALEQLLSALEDQTILVILDNCEHLAEHVGSFIQMLQMRAARASVLVTSQEPVVAATCKAYRLGSLEIPATGSPLYLARATGALQLLEVRARAIDRRFALTTDNVDAAIDIVASLDGIPLAIEMAAARIPVFGVEMLRSRLVEPFRVLHQAVKAPLSRHQSWRATLEWGNSLLSGTERTALRRLSAFVGSFPADAAQRVIADEEVDEWGALDALSALVDKSLVQLEAIEPPRYRLLETVRHFEADQCARTGEEDDVLLRHGRAMAGLAEEVEASYWDLSDAAWLQRYAAYYEDLRAAFERACLRRDAGVAALTGIALTRLDHLRNVDAPRRDRAAAMHGLLPRADLRAQAWIWSNIASQGLIPVEVVSRLEAAHNAVEAWKREGDRMQLHYALGFHATEAARAGDFPLALTLLGDARQLEDTSWPLRRRMWACSAKAGVCIHMGDAAGYRDASRGELELAIKAGAFRAAAWARLKLADAALMAGDVNEAIVLGQEAVVNLRDLQQPSNLGLALSKLSAALLKSGDSERARIAAMEALPLMWRNGLAYLLLDAIAVLAAMEGRYVHALKILGYVGHWYIRHGDSRQPNEAALASRARMMCTAVFEQRESDAIVTAGESLSDEEAELLATVAIRVET